MSLDLSTLKTKEVRVFETWGLFPLMHGVTFQKKDSLSTFEGAVNRADESCVI